MPAYGTKQPVGFIESCVQKRLIRVVVLWFALECVCAKKNGGPSQTRTGDLPIMSYLCWPYSCLYLLACNYISLFKSASYIYI